MANAKRVCAWYNKAEWIAVYKDLFSSDPVLQRHGVDKIAVWKCRVLHRLSTAIECTSELVRADLLHKQYAQHSSRQQEVRLVMAMALTRFVNLITEKYQQTSYAQPIHQMALQAGLPDWMVDMRHDATHSSLPSIHMLRTALNTALQWIQENYWEAQLREDDSVDDTSSTPFVSPASFGRQSPSHSASPSHTTKRDALSLDPETVKYKSESLLNTYVQLSFQKRKGLLTDEGNQIRTAIDGIEKLLHVPAHREAVVEACLERGFLISTEKQLKLLDVDINALLDSDQLCLPQELLSFWRPLVRSLHHKKCTTLLLQKCGSLLTEGASLSNRLRCGWIDTILTNAADPGAFRRGLRIFDQEFEVNTRLLIERVLTRPGKYTLLLLQSMFSRDNCGLHETQQNQLLECLSQYTDQQLASKETDQKVPEEETRGATDVKLFTVKDFAAFRDTSTSDAAGDDVEVTLGNNVWTLCKDPIDWSLYPIGSCPGFTVDCHNMELSQPSTNEHLQVSSPCSLCDVDMESLDRDDTLLKNDHSVKQWTDAQIKEMAKKISFV